MKTGIHPDPARGADDLRDVRHELRDPDERR